MRRMIQTYGVVGVLLAAAALLPAAPAMTQEREAPEAPPAAAEAPAMPPEMMEAWAKAATPGAPHEKLAEMVGTWKMKTTAWMAPGAPPVESTGSAIFEMILGGRYLHETVKGDMMGQPFTGIAVTGYDNVRERYVSTWMDDMGTGIFTSEGEMDADGTMHMEGDMVDPLTGATQHIRMVTRKESPDRYVFEWYEPGPDGAERKAMEIVYTRP